MRVRESAQVLLLERSWHRSQGKGGPMRVRVSAQFLLLERSWHRSKGKGGSMRVREAHNSFSWKGHGIGLRVKRDQWAGAGLGGPSSARFTETERSRVPLSNFRIPNFQIPLRPPQLLRQAASAAPKLPCRRPPDQGSKRFSPVHLHRRPSFLGSDETTSPSEPRALDPASPPKPPVGRR